jgi:hypothetical protein
MQRGASDEGWKAYALTGRPDFLNYLRRGDVTWRELWAYYRETPADPAAMARLMGLFHMFLSQDYDREGCVLDRDGPVYEELREWVRLAVACEEFLPEEKLRDSLASLLGQSLVSPLYYEAAFSVYLETSLEKHLPVHMSAAFRTGTADPGAEARDRRLAIRLPELPRYPESLGGARWDDSVSALVGRHYTAWNHAYVLALGEEEPDWRDEGGSG